MSETYRVKKSVATNRRSYHDLPAKPFVRTLPKPADRLQTETERQFTTAVQAKMEGPLLRYSNRLELMNLAERLNLGRFQANLLIAQAQQRTGRADEILVRQTNQPQSAVSAKPENTLRDRLILAGAIFILSALVDMIVIRLFFTK